MKNNIYTCSAVQGSWQASAIAVSASLALLPHFTSPILSTRPSRTICADVLEKVPFWAIKATIWSFICITCKQEEEPLLFSSQWSICCTVRFETYISSNMTSVCLHYLLGTIDTMSMADKTSRTRNVFFNLHALKLDIFVITLLCIHTKYIHCDFSLEKYKGRQTAWWDSCNTDDQQ